MLGTRQMSNSLQQTIYLGEFDESYLNKACLSL